MFDVAKTLTNRLGQVLIKSEMVSNNI